MNAIQALNLRSKERKALVTHLTETLQTDDRVAAAALTGSYALRRIDGLSDLDILVIIEVKLIATLREVKENHQPQSSHI